MRNFFSARRLIISTTGLAALVFIIYLVFNNIAVRENPVEPIFSFDFSGWHRIHTTVDGIQCITSRREGLSHLLIFAGKSADSRSEIAPARSEILKNGYDILTVEPAKKDTLSAALPESSVGEFLSFAAARPGYSAKIFAVYGSHLKTALNALRGRKISALIVIHPGDANVQDPELHLLVSGFDVKTPVLWIGSQSWPEQPRGEYLATFLKSPPQKTTSIPVAERKDSTNMYVYFNDIFYSFILLNRLPVEWIDAGKVFLGGCSIYPNGYGKVGIQRYRVSARREADFCPLFIQSPGGTLHIALSVVDKGCEYAGGPFFWKLFCRY